MLYLLHWSYGPIIPIIRVGVWQVLVIVCLPIAVVKTAISLVHLVEASQAVAEVDVQERAKAPAPQPQPTTGNHND